MSQRASGSTTPNSTGQSTPPPPSAFRSNVLGSSSTLLGLGGASNSTGVSRPLRNRLSRNFDDILREDDTVQLRGGNLDESKLGVVFTPPSARTGAGDYSFNTTLSTEDDEERVANLLTDSPLASSITMSRLTRNAGQPTFNLQPATPIVVPPTPLASNSPADPSASNTTIDSSVEDSLENARADLLPVSQPLPSSSNASKRRSLLRSPGTSSSPDLATLVRKARERGGIIGGGGNNTTPNPKEASNKAEITISAARPTTSSGSASQPSLEVAAIKQARPTTSNGPSSFLAPNASRMRTTSSTSSFSIVNTPDSTPSYSPFGGSNASSARLASATVSAGSSKKLSKQSSTGLSVGSETSPQKGISGGKEPPKVSNRDIHSYQIGFVSICLFA